MVVVCLSVGTGQRTGQVSFKGGLSQRSGQPLLALSGNRACWGWCCSSGLQGQVGAVPIPKGLRVVWVGEEFPALTAAEFVSFPRSAPSSLNLRMGGNPTVSPHGQPQPPQSTFSRYQDRAGFQAWNALDCQVGLQLKWKTLRTRQIMGLRTRSLS